MRLMRMGFVHKLCGFPKEFPKILNRRNLWAIPPNRERFKNYMTFPP